MNDQMNLNAMRREAELAERRALVPTSFGPAEDDNVALTHLAK